MDDQSRNARGESAANSGSEHDFAGAMPGIRRNIVANYASGFWVAIMAVAFIPAYIHYLGVEAYGLIGVFMVVQGCLALLDLGLAPAITREMAQPMPAGSGHARDLLRSVEIALLVLAVALGIAFGLVADEFALGWLRRDDVGPDEAAHSFALMGWLVGMRVFENVYRGTLVGRQRQVLLSGLVMLLATLRAAGAVAVLAWVEPSLPAFFRWQVLAGVISVLALGIAAHAVLPRAGRRARPARAHLRSISGFAAGSLGIAVTSILLMNLDKLLLSRLLDLEQYAYYALAWAVAQLPAGLVGALAQAVYPRMSALLGAGQSQEAALAYHWATQLVTVLIGATSIALATFSLPVLLAWTGDRELALNAHSLLRWLVLGSLVNGIMTIPYYLQLAAGWTGLTLRFNLVLLCAFLPLLVYAVEFRGAEGAAVCWLAINLCYPLFIMPRVHARVLRGHLREWYLADVGAPLAVMATLALAMHLLAPETVGAAYLLVAGGVIAGGGLLAASRLRGRLAALLRG